ncbi:MAG: GIY-YIG nuclease family protein [Clostridium butyricum]
MTKAICGIYKITNVINNKIYIGQSINIHKRWIGHRNDFKRPERHNIYFHRAWIKYGEENFKFEIIEEYNVEKLNERERYWISVYNSSNRLYGYNADEGANGKVLNEETRYLMGKGNRGKLRNVKPVLQIGLDGEIIKRWSNINEIKRELNVKSTGALRGCLKRERYTYRGFIWIYEEEYDNFDLHDYLRKKQKQEIIQLSLDGEFIREWNSIKEASKSLRISDWTISYCCKRKREKASGYKWIYKRDYKREGK